jgi:hypothetical protein
MGIAATPCSLLSQRGASLVELLIYSIILSVVLLAVYQTRDLFTKKFNQSISASTAVIDSNFVLSALQQEVQLSDVSIKIVDQPQNAGAPSGSGTANCIEMKKTVLGVHTPYSISARWDNTSKAFKLVHYKTNGCSSPPVTTNTADLSKPIFQLPDSVNFFTGIGLVVSNGYKEVNYNFKTRTGKGELGSGLANTSVQLSSNSLTPHECRVASPDKSWFTNFEGKLIKSVTVSVSQNYEPGYDILNFLGAPTDVVVKQMADIGVVHLHARLGRSVADWLSILSNITYTRDPTAPAVTESSPPKQISFILGDGLTFSPATATSAHFYIAIQLKPRDSNDATTFKYWDNVDAKASSYCYPAFADDPGYLASGVSPTATNSCSSSDFKRLRGHLLTITTEGEQAFVQNKLLKMVYPESAPYVSGVYSGAFSQTEANRAPTTGQFWMGGTPKDSYNLKWHRGDEAKNPPNGYSYPTPFATRTTYGGTFTGAGIPASAGKFFVSLDNSTIVNSYNPQDHKLYYTIEGSGSPLRYWRLKSPSINVQHNEITHAVIEFGDNYLALEDNVNAQIRLKKDVRVIPFEFFNSCRQ